MAKWEFFFYQKFNQSVTLLSQSLFLLNVVFFCVGGTWKKRAHFTWKNSTSANKIRRIMENMLQRVFGTLQKVPQDPRDLQLLSRPRHPSRWHLIGRKKREKKSVYVLREERRCSSSTFNRINIHELGAGIGPGLISRCGDKLEWWRINKAMDSHTRRPSLTPPSRLTEWVSESSTESSCKHQHQAAFASSPRPSEGRSSVFWLGRERAVPLRTPGAAL